MDTSNTLKTEEKFFLMIKDGDVLDKYNEIWGLIQEKLNNKFHSILVHDETLIKAKVREFDSKTKTNILGGKVPKENMHLTCIACITLDSVMRIEKKNYYLFLFLKKTLYSHQRFNNTFLLTLSKSKKLIAILLL